MDLLDVAAKGTSLNLREMLQRHDPRDPTTQMALTHACHHGNKPCVLELLRAGVDVNGKDIFFAPIFYTVAQNNVEILDILVAAGANLNLLDQRRYTPLIEAATEGSAQCVERLLSLPNVNTNLVELDGETALMRAAGSNQPDCLRLLVAEPEAQINRQNRNGSTALILAARQNNCLCIEILLAQPGIDVEIKDRYGRTALFNAVYSASRDAIETLLAVPGINLNVLDRDRFSMIDFVSDHGMKSIVLRMMKAGISIPENPTINRNPLMCVASAGEIQYTKTLLQNGFSLLRCDEGRKNSFYFAAVNGRVEWLRTFIPFLSDSDKLHAGIKYAFLSSAKMRNIFFCLPAFFEGRAFSWSWYPEYFKPTFRSLVQQMVVTGLPPGSFIYAGLQVSPLLHALLINDVGVARYLMASLYLGPHDLPSFPPNGLIREYIRSTGSSTGMRESVEMYRRIYSTPWSLSTLAFLTISTCLRNDRLRRQTVRKSGLANMLPEVLQARLCFQTKIRWLPPNKWNSIHMPVPDFKEPVWPRPEEVQPHFITREIILDSIIHLPPRAWNHLPDNSNRQIIRRDLSSLELLCRDQEYDPLIDLNATVDLAGTGLLDWTNEEVDQR